MNIVVCGAGVIGASIAYYLSGRGVDVTVIERTGVACAASGKSGGFLARDWCDGSPQEALAHLSFDLHTDLARNLNADYGYRRVETLQLAAGDSEKIGAYRRIPAPEWLDGDCAVYAMLGTTNTTAQIHPGHFTRALMNKAVAQGAVLHLGCVTGIELNTHENRVTGVRVQTGILPADAVVVALGPWTITAARWLPLPAVAGLKSHSITLRPRNPVPPQALFVEFISGPVSGESPEIIPRADGEIYVCGIADDLPLPEDPALVAVSEPSCRALHELAGKLSSDLDEGEVTAMQACYRPVCRDTMPLMGRIPGILGAYVATGHNCWGMLNAPASGLAMSELIAEGQAKSLDLSPFDPARLEPVPGP